jgi:hypothetical protein
MRNMRLTVLAACLVLAACVSANATAPGYQLTLRNPMPAATGYIWTTGMSGYENCYIGPITLEVRKLNESTGAYDFLGYQRSLCVDLLGTITTNSTWYANLATDVPNGVLGADAAAKAANWDRVVWIAQSNPGWTYTEGPEAFNAVSNAGLQVAVWEALRDGSSFNLTGGNFKLGSTSAGTSIATAAQQFFANSSDFTLGFANGHLYFEAGNWDANGNKLAGCGQDQLFFITQPNTPTVPEFPVPILCPLGLMIIGTIKRRFAK